MHGLLQDGKNGEAMRTFLKGIGMPKLFVYLMRLIPGWKTMTALAPTLAYDIALTRDLPPLDRASHVMVPVRVIVGERSPAGIHVVASRLAEAIPGGTLTRLPGQGHMVNAKALLPVLASFLESAGRAAVATVALACAAISGCTMQVRVQDAASPSGIPAAGPTIDVDDVYRFYEIYDGAGGRRPSSTVKTFPYSKYR